MADPKPKVSSKLTATPIFWLVIVSVVALVERLLVILLYQPVAYSDTPSYRRLADTVLQGFTSYDGTRTPGYPVFLALVGNDQRVWLVQLLLGLIATLLLFYIGWKLTDKPWFGGLIALAHTLNLGQLFFESNLLTESLTTFLLIAIMAGMLAWLLYPKVRSYRISFFIRVIICINPSRAPAFYLPSVLPACFFMARAQNIPATCKVIKYGTHLLQKIVRRQ